MLQGLFCADKPRGSALELHCSRLRSVHSRDDLGERRLTGAVFSDKAADATRNDGKIHAAKRVDCRKAPREAFAS
jgi:hypothetical protein